MVRQTKGYSLPPSPREIMRARLFCLQTHIEQTLGPVSVQPEREQQPAERGDTRRAERETGRVKVCRNALLQNPEWT